MTTLYLKYRPQTLNDLDLVEVRNTISNMVKTGSIPHALLFCGPRGSGKTSAARILAKIINCNSKDKKIRGDQLQNPCNVCEQCVSITKGTNIDVIEMDAASHRGIDDVRNLKDAVKLAPAKAIKKIYIIDEAHMLTTEASNALLKTLEEPPEHVIFILATTNPEKLIETIRSRTAVVSFKKASIAEIVNSLRQVVEKEKLKIGARVLEAIAKNSDGSFRDAKKSLEQLIVDDLFKDGERALEYLNNNNLFNLEHFFENLSGRNIKNALKQIENAVNGGVAVSTLNEKILSRLHSAVLFENGIGGEEIAGLDLINLIDLIEKISQKIIYQNYVPIEHLPLELAISEWGTRNSSENMNSGGGGKPTKKTFTVKNISEGKNTEKISAVETNENESDEKRSNGFNLDSIDGGNFDDDLWNKVLCMVRPKNPSTEALLRAAKPIKLSDEYLFLGVYYSFHKEKLESTQHKLLLEDTLQTVIGKKLKVQCFLTEPPTRKNSDDFNAPVYEEKTKSKNPVSENGQNSGYDFKEPPHETLNKSDVLLTEPEDEDIIKLAEEIFGK